jgi:hypothetical protein
MKAIIGAIGLVVAAAGTAAAQPQCPVRMPQTANAVWNVCDARNELVGTLLGQGSVVYLAADGVPYALPFTVKGGLKKNAVFAYAADGCAGQKLIIEPGDDGLPVLGQWDGSTLWKAGPQTISLTAHSLYYTEVEECARGQNYAFTGGIATVVGKPSFPAPFALK